MVALRYLKARREEGVISVIAGFSLAGIALGVATLIVVMSVMNGFRAELIDRIVGLNGHMGVYAAQPGPLRAFDAAADRLRGLDGVLSVAPVVEGQVMATANGVAYGAVVRGIRRDDVAAREIVAGNLRQGSLAEFRGFDRILVGARFARRFGVGVGDAVRLVSPQSEPTAFGSLPRIKTYRVAAVFEVGMFEYDSSFVFMPLAAAQRYFRTGRGVTSLELTVAEPDRVAALRDDVVSAAGTPVRVVDWQDANSSYFNALEVERNVMFLILTLIILVAAFNIVSGLIMLVKDKGRDIAILRTMGATRGMVMRIFFLAGASVGVVGTSIGFALGLVVSDNIETLRRWLEGLTGGDLFAAEIYFLSQLPSKVETGDVISVIAMSLALSLIATIHPAWRASRVDPVEALRYE